VFSHPVLFFLFLLEFTISGFSTPFLSAAVLDEVSLFSEARPLLLYYSCCCCCCCCCHLLPGKFGFQENPLLLNRFFRGGLVTPPSPAPPSKGEERGSGPKEEREERERDLEETRSQESVGR